MVSYNESEYLINVISLIGLILIMVWVTVHMLFNKLNNENNNNDAFKLKADISGFCENPSCLRCNKNVFLMENAKRNFMDIEEEVGIQRIKKSIIEADADAESISPHLLYINDLVSIPIWSIDDLPTSYKLDYYLLKENINVFIKDYDKLQFSGKNDGCWSKLFLLNQGVIDSQHSKICCETSYLLEQCANLMGNCVFAYRFFSILHPNSTIEEHYGPTNCRLRCHIPLQVPYEEYADCKMNVDDTIVNWKEGELLLFDDSLNHSVSYEANENYNVDRVVLLVDFWHPDLTLLERECIKKCYSSHSYN